MGGPQLCLGRCILEHVELVDENGEEALHQKKRPREDEKHDNGNLHIDKALVMLEMNTRMIQVGKIQAV